MVVTMTLIWLFYDGFWERRLKSNPNSSAQHYLTYIKTSSTNKWLYYSYIMSTLHAIGCYYFAFATLLSCETPQKYSGSGKFGNTFIGNEYCVDNASIL